MRHFPTLGDRSVRCGVRGIELEQAETDLRQLREREAGTAPRAHGPKGPRNSAAHLPFLSFPILLQMGGSGCFITGFTILIFFNIQKICEDLIVLGNIVALFISNHVICHKFAIVHDHQNSPFVYHHLAVF